MRRMGSIGRKICQRIKFADENGVIILGAGILIQVHLHAADERDGIRQGFQQPFHLVQVSAFVAPSAVSLNFHMTM